ncbi:MAG: hypothetical protein PX635_15300 [Nostocales cyanobacterium LE14-WE12]|nr:hypothetical protein [Nostocales cyanobacterium LE14-WE12]
MRPVRFDLIGDLKIERGSEWRRRTFAIEGDFTSWLIFGEVRKKAGGDLFGAFDFEPMIPIIIPINGVETEFTRIVPFLRASVALALPPTKSPSAGQAIVVGRHRWEYDIKIRHPTNFERIFTPFEGLVEVSDRVTEVLV